MNDINASYVAGFLDGDGSIHFQLVKQAEYRFGFYIRASLSFSQSTSVRWVLEEIRTMIGAGYVRDRGTGMSDLVITSRPVLRRVLEEISPHARVKRERIRLALKLLPLLDHVTDPLEYLRLARMVDAFATLNYSKTKRITAADVEQYLRSKGVLCPCNDFLESYSEEMA
jgi:hypothetical protein